MTQLNPSNKPDPDNKYAHWSDTRLKSTHAYYRGCLKDGHPAIYDSEEDRLHLLDIAGELTRRGIQPKRSDEQNDAGPSREAA